MFMTYSSKSRLLKLLTQATVSALLLLVVVSLSSVSEMSAQPAAQSQDLIPPSIMDGLPSMVRGELVKLSAQKQQQFLEEYKRKAKSVGVAYTLWLIFPPFGSHYAYLGDWGMQLLHWLTVGGFGIWWLIDGFRIPSMVQDYNRDLSIDILRNLKAISD